MKDGYVGMKLFSAIVYANFKSSGPFSILKSKSKLCQSKFLSLSGYFSLRKTSCILFEVLAEGYS